MKSAALVAALALVVIAPVLISSNPKIACELRNVLREDLAKQVREKTVRIGRDKLDFRPLSAQFDRVCVVEIYTVGEFYLSEELTRTSVKLEGKNICSHWAKDSALFAFISSGRAGRTYTLVPYEIGGLPHGGIEKTGQLCADIRTAVASCFDYGPSGNRCVLFENRTGK